MVGLLAGGLALACGGFATRGVAISVPLRLGLGTCLGLALWIAWSLLVAPFASSPTAIVLGGAVLALLWSYRFPVSAPARGKMSLALGLLAALLMLIGWLEVVGGAQLDPPRELILFDLPRVAQLALSPSTASHPLGPASLSQVSPLAPLVSVWPADPLRSCLLMAGLTQAAAVMAWFLWGALRHRTAGFAVGLGGLALFWGTSQGFLVTQGAWDGAIHLLLLGSFLLADLRGAVWTLPFLLALGLLSPVHALAGALYLLGRQRALPWLALCLAVVSVLFHGASAGHLVAVYLYLRSRRSDIRGLSLASLALPGALEWAALGLSLGRLWTALWRGSRPGRWGLAQGPLQLTLPTRLPLLGLALLLCWRALIGGEEVFNDEILIRAQKEKASLARLAVPHRLDGWAAWRGHVVGFVSEDLQALPALPGSDSVLYQTGAPSEQAEVSALLSALAGGRPISGWYAGEQGVSPYPAVAAYFATGDPTLLRSTPIRRVLRRAQDPLEIPPWPDTLETDQAAAVWPARMEAWGKRLWYRADGPTGYLVKLDGEPFGPDYPVRTDRDQEIPFVPPLLPGQVELEWTHGAQETPPTWPLLAELKIPDEIPTRSLLTVALELENPTSMTVSLDQVKSLRWRFLRLKSTRPGEVSPLVPFAPMTLAPNQTVSVEVSLRTPPEMGTYDISLEMVDSLGEAHPVEFRSPLTVRTWRRHPLVAVPDGVVRVAP